MSLEELKKDIAEIKELTQQATRKRVQDVLSEAQYKLEIEVRRLEEKARIQAAADKQPSTPNVDDNKTFTVELNEYAWDQSDKFVKIFATLDGVQSLTEADVETVFTPNSVVLTIRNLNNKIYRLTMNNLLGNINVEKSYRKIKTGMVAIYMKKEKESEKWSHLTFAEKRVNDIKDSMYKPADDAKDDPSAGLMNMMKKMYDSGDSETKRMIAKAWTENQEKQMSGPFNPE